ncbi:MAG: CPBP family intramembrane metalloprotease [Actinomycetota bacterium]|nr:CPBP family intramembrane metalloprotease [Actinomycetota bacterium]MDQ2957531.1 CPBP family intramembrane metalloprotease [Actinomycetota bacterium]
MTTAPSSAPAVAAAPDARRSDRLGLEILLVLGVSLGISAIDSLINFADIQTRGGFRNATATLNPSQSPRAWVDLSYQLLGLLNGVVPALLALLLLSRLPGLPGFGIGFDRLRLRLESLQGLGFAALIGIPGLGLVILARHLGVNAQLDASDIANIWYRYPILVLQGIQNGVLEEIVMIGYLLTRLRQLNWPTGRAILLSAVIRGSYHTYQGLGGFIGNLIMGALFGWWFTRTKRVLPLVIAHSVIDIVSFVGYAALHSRVSWI